MRSSSYPKLLVLSLLLATTPPAVGDAPARQAQSVEVTYLGNEGFLITAGNTKILVDALFGDGIKGYPVVALEPRRQLEAASGPYAEIDLVLATHYHDDHFNAEAVARHLRNNPEARFVSTRQAVEKLRRVDRFDQIRDRVDGFWPAEGTRTSIEHAGVQVTVLNLHHGRGRKPEVQNLGFIIHLGNLRFLHVGDTEVGIDDVRPYALGEADIDVLFAPTWFFTYDSFEPVRAAVDADVRVVMHIAEPSAPSSWFGPDRSRAKRLERIRRVDPEAIILEAMATYQVGAR